MLFIFPAVCLLSVWNILPVDGATTCQLLRVAKGYQTDQFLNGQTPIIARDAWLNTQVYPPVGTSIDSAAVNSNDPSEKLFFKSSIVDCAWNKVDTVRVSVYKNGVEDAFMEFNRAGKDKLAWFHPNQLSSSSYTDLEGSKDLPTAIFSIDGIDNNFLKLAQHFLLHKDVPDCNNDQLWLGLEENRFRPEYCAWLSRTDGDDYLPIIHHSNQATAILGTEAAIGDVLRISAILNDDCVCDCEGRADGVYKSCTACDVYVDCTDGQLTELACNAGEVFDEGDGSCDTGSCVGGETPEVCKPGFVPVEPGPVGPPDVTGASEKLIYFIESGFTSDMLLNENIGLTPREVWYERRVLLDGFSPVFGGILPTIDDTQPGVERGAFKSPVTECAFDKVLQIRIDVIKNNAVQQFFLFNAAGLGKNDWFKPQTLEDSSYTNLKGGSTVIFDLFGLQQFVNDNLDDQVSRFAYIQENDAQFCDEDLVYFTCVQEPNGYCPWDNIGGADKPQCLFSPTNGPTIANNLEVADRVEFWAIFDGAAFGGDCRDSCEGVIVGTRKHSCQGCNVFIECVAEFTTLRNCGPDREFDANLGKCVLGTSPTCGNDRKAFPGCVITRDCPSGSQLDYLTNQCYSLQFNPATVEQARQTCEDNGGELAVVDDPEQISNFLEDNYSGNTDDILLQDSSNSAVVYNVNSQSLDSTGDNDVQQAFLCVLE